MIYIDGQKIKEQLVDIDIKKKYELRLNEDMLISCMAQLSHELDLERPVMVGKHIRDLCEFGRAVFLPQDFMESVDFDRLVVELIP